MVVYTNINLNGLEKKSILIKIHFLFCLTGGGLIVCTKINVNNWKKISVFPNKTLFNMYFWVRLIVVYTNINNNCFEKISIFNFILFYST